MRCRVFQFVMHAFAASRGRKMFAFHARHFERAFSRRRVPPNRSPDVLTISSGLNELSPAIRDSFSLLVSREQQS
jgi:hypothetical protein